ncbi:choice-of-anchor D domain-containing protein, partial [bacterium]|nr:choice-of-anchor D domain-containing protein [bacterium]
NALRIANSSDVTGTYIAVLPQIENMGSRMKFWAKCSSTGSQLIVGYLADVADAATFTEIQTVNMTSTYEEHTVELELPRTVRYLALKHANVATYQTIYIDNVLIEEIPTTPLIEVVPSSYSFPLTLTGESRQTDINIKNIGIGSLLLTDITITGQDADQFSLGVLNINELTSFEETNLEVYYHPTIAGDHSAEILVNDNFNIITETINITGSASQVFDGQGTQESPYLINVIDDLIKLSNFEQVWDKHFVQTANIDASSTSDLNDGAGFSPIGTNANPFTGSYDGQGHTISNLYINRPSTSNVGLFGYTQSASISNLGIVDAEIIGDDYVGGLVGSASSSSTISNSYAIGAVSGTSDYVGGLVGYASSSTISNSYATGAVSGSSNVGGLVGRAYSSTISKTYATGAVSGSSSVGGLVGYRSGGSVNNSFWDTETSGQTSSAGGSGKTTAQMQDINTYLSAGWDFTDLWYINSAINSGYPVFFNNVIQNNQIANNATHISLTPTISFSINTNFQYYELYFASSPSPETNIIPFSPVSNPVTYTFTDSLEYFTDYYWTVVLYDANYEVTSFDFTFKTRPILDGLGTQESPYLINNITDLITLSEDQYYWDKHLAQTANIDASSTSDLNDGAGFSPICYDYNNGFTGSYDGQGHTISNLYVNRPSTAFGGLFGRIQGAFISNLGIEDAEIIVNRSQYVGGLVGFAWSSTISKTYVTGAVSGGTSVGGLVGSSGFSTISNSYATGAVSGSSNVGGLIGNNYNNTSTITNSFWDTETSGQTTSQGGSGKTSLEMKSQSTYLNAGWDFVGEEINGSEDIWYIHPSINSGYPTFVSCLTLPGALPINTLSLHPIDLSGDLLISDNLLWNPDHLELTSGYRLNIGTDNPPSNLVNNEDLGFVTSYDYTNLQANTSYYWQVIPYNDNGEAEDCPIWSFTTGSASLVSVGSGNDTTAPLPINHAVRRSYSQSIYLQSELNIANRQIEKLSFYLTSEFDLAGANQWKVYLGHTDKTDFSSTNDWLLVNQGLTQVADVTLSDTTNTGWVQIELDTPFAYNNSDNLIVGVIEYSAETSNNLDFYTVETDSNRSLSFGHDSTTPNPNIPYGGQLSTSIPKVNFTFSQSTTRFTGLVQNSASIPISGAIITITELGTYPTNTLGEFNAHNIEAGIYQLTVSAPWYETQIIEYEVIEGQDNYLEITLLEDLLPASSLTATLAEDLTNVELTWTQPTLARVANSSKQAMRSLSQAKNNLTDKQSSEQRTGQPDLVYNLYRYLAGDEASPDNWFEVATNLDALTYSDTSFPSLDLGSYYWAVQAVYPNDRLAQATISNQIDKQATIETNIEEEINFGTVYLTNASEYEEIIITNSGSGTLTISEITCEESAFNLLYDPADFIIEPGSSMTLQVNFAPDNPGSYVGDLVIANNSSNEPNYTLSLRGFCQYIPPANPGEVQVNMINNTSQISWDPVTEDIYENPVTPDLYVVYYNGQNTSADNDYYFLAYTSELNYNHVGVGIFSGFMFYRVKAYVDVDNTVLSQINDLVSRKEQVTMKEVEKLLRKKKSFHTN